MDNPTNTTSTDTETKTKESSVMDFTYLSLNELEDEVARTFPNEECAECSFHLDLLGALPFRLMHHGWTKDEVLEFFIEQVNDASDLLLELEQEDKEKEVVSPTIADSLRWNELRICEDLKLGEKSGGLPINERIEIGNRTITKLTQLVGALEQTSEEKVV